jgi:6-phosphogluconolactonase (cycloisomerase 2 family)
MNPIQYIASDTTSSTEKKGSADIHLSPDGKFLYSSNRLQSDGIAIFNVDENTGLLNFIGYQTTGIHPRNFTITPNGKFLLVANRDSNNIQIFNIDKQTGLLHDLGKEIQLNKPVYLNFIKK